MAIIIYKLNERQKQDLYNSIFDTKKQREEITLYKFIKQNVTLHIDIIEQTAKWEFFQDGKDMGTMKDDFQGCLDLIFKETKVQIIKKIIWTQNNILKDLIKEFNSNNTSPKEK